MRITFNLDQKKALSNFFTSIAVAWFGAAFITSATLPGIGLLKLLGFIANILLSLYLALYLLKEDR